MTWGILSTYRLPDGQQRIRLLHDNVRGEPLSFASEAEAQAVVTRLASVPDVRFAGAAKGQERGAGERLMDKPDIFEALLLLCAVHLLYGIMRLIAVVFYFVGHDDKGAVWPSASVERDP